MVGLTAPEIERLYPDRLAQWRAGVFDDLPGAEPWGLFSGRVEAGVRAVADRPRGHRRVLVVTPAGALRAVERSLGVGLRKTTNLDGYWVRVEAGAVASPAPPPEVTDRRCGGEANVRRVLS